MKKLFILTIFSTILTSCVVKNTSCNIHPKKLQSYSEYCKSNNIKDKKVKKEVIIETSINPMFR